MKRCYVYIFIDHNTGNPVYVGKGCGRRLSQHTINVRRGRRGHLYNWMRKYETLNGVLPIPLKIAEGLSGQEACDFEKALIAFYGRQDIKTGCLFNLTDGGEGTNGRIVTVETRAKMSAKRKGWKPSSETIAKRAISMVGYKHSAATKAKMSLAQKSRSPISDETRAKISATLKGRVFSAETIAKMSESKKGKPHPHIGGGGRGKGFVVPVETRAKISETLKEIRKTIPPANKGKRKQLKLVA